MKKMLLIVLTMVLLLSAFTIASAAEKKDLVSYETRGREVDTWNVLYSQWAASNNVLVNLVDGLMTNDNHGNMQLNAAKSYETTDDGQTWVFTLNEGMTWFNKDGEYQADVLASDWATGLEWVLNYAKNDLQPPRKRF